MYKRSNHLALAIAAITLSGTGAAKEQLVLEEITVTAQKTTEMAQDVPVAMNAITGDTFEKNVAMDLQDLGKLVPGLQMTTTGVQQNITLRGVGAELKGPISPRVSTFVDGSVVNNQQLVFFSQFDIARFEVLRGPQGTLYGKTSPTGSLIIHTRNPDLTQTEGFVQTTVGQHDLFNTQFGVSLPVIENKLGVRFAGVYDENNSPDGEYANGPDQLSRSKSGRMTVFWKPLDNLDVRLAHTNVDTDHNQSSAFADVPSIGLSPYKRIELSNQPREGGALISMTTLEMNLDLDDFVLTSQSFYAKGNVDELKDMDRTPTADAFQDTRINYNHLLNQEFRIASSGNDFWDWMGGIYYGASSADTTVQNFSYRGGTFLPLDTRVRLLSSTEDFGLFTHNTFFLSDDWTLTAGARWSREKRGNLNSADTFYTGIPGNPILVNSALTDTPAKYIAWTGTVKLSYKLTPDSMAYFTIDRGGRIGGQSLDLSGFVPDEIQEFSPEFSNSFELGYKSDLMDGRMRFNAATYYQIYKDFHYQQNSIALFSGPTTRYVDVLQSAKEAKVAGIEVDVTYLFNENFTGSVSVNYNDAKFEDFKDALCNDPTGTLINGSTGDYYVCDASGERLGGDSGNWSAVVSANYSAPVEALSAEWYTDVLYNFNSMRVAPSTDTKSGSFGLIDVFVGLRSNEQTWDVKVWAKNLLDKEAMINENVPESLLYNTFPTGITPQERVVRPRQVGVTGIYRF